MLLRYVQILLLFCAVCYLTLAFPTQSPPGYDEVRQLQLNIPLSGVVVAPLGSSISIPCLVSLASTPSSSSSTPVVPRVKWTVVSDGVETQILVARGQRVKINETYQDRAALLNYISSPDDLSLSLGDLHHSDSGHYRCEVQQGLDDASDLIQLKVKGVVFHYRDAFDRYAFSFQQAKKACEAIGAQIATPGQLLAAYYDGYEQCDAGWLADQSVRYPIQVPREGCYGDMDGQPGVRNYGTMDADDLFDVYCYVEQIDGEVFHDSVPQQFSFDEAQSYCRAAGAELATAAQLYSAWSEGLDHCSPGWLSDGSVRYPIITPRERCGGPQAGVKTVYRFSNQTGFPEPSSLHDVYCFKKNTKKSSDFPMDNVTTEAEDIGQNVVILTQKDQELQLNQQAEQVEREAQSVLESLPFFSGFFTGRNSVDTHPTVISDTTDSPSSTSLVDLLHDKTSEIGFSQQPTGVSRTISSTDSYSPPQNSSFLPSVYNDTDYHQNQSFSFQSELERTTYTPHTQNQTVPDINLQETTPLYKKLKHPQDLHKSNLTFDSPLANYNETDRNHTQEEGFWEATALTVNPMHQVKLEEAAVEGPVQMPLTTLTSKEEGILPTQATQTNESATETLTSLWANMDGSGVISQEKDIEVDEVTYVSSSRSSTASFTTPPSPSALASIAPTEPQTAGQDHPLLSGSRPLDRLSLDIFSTAPQLWISRQEGSTSLETGDTLHTESDEKLLQSTESVDQLVPEVSFAVTESPEGLNTSHTPPKITTAHDQTSSYRIYLDTVTSSYEEASGFEPGIVSSTLREDIKHPTSVPTLEEEFTVFPVIEEEANVSFSLEKEVKVAPTFILEVESEVTAILEVEGGANVAPAFEEEIKVAPTPVIEEETKVAPTNVHEERAAVAPTFEEEAKVASTIDYEEANGVTPLFLEAKDKVIPTLDYKEEANGATSLVLEGEDKVVPTLDYEEEANSATYFVLEGEDKVVPTLAYEEEANGVTSLVLEREDKVIPTLDYEEEANGATLLVLEGEDKVVPTLAYEEEANGVTSLVLEREDKVIPTLDYEEEANGATLLVLEGEDKVVPTLAYEEEANGATSLVLEEGKVVPTLDYEEEANGATSLVLEGEDKVVPTLAYEEEANGATSLVLEEGKVVPTLDYEEEANGVTSLVLEGEDKVVPTLDYEEEANSVTSLVLEGEDKVVPNLKDFTISPLNSQTSKWALRTTTAGPQVSLNDFRRKFSSTAASDSSVSTKPIAAAAKTTTTTISTTTHWSRHIWSPTTTTTAEPQKVTHIIPPVDHGLIDVEISLTQPPTLLILPNERAAIGGTGKSSDACMDNPCLNGGTCTEWDGQVKCLCLPTYEGDLCQNDLEQCEPGWDKFHGFCYRHFSQRLSWEAAEQHCRKMGAHLVSIMTPEEQDYINSNYKEYQWTGLNDKTIEDDFRWSDGNPLLYENWYRGQPDSYFLSGEDCVVMVWHDNGRWSDVPCNYHLSYTCKKGTTSCGPPPKVRNASIFGKARQRYETNAIVRYHCAEGFQQRLNPLIRCLSGGRWERPQILCISGQMQLPDVTSLTDSNLSAAENESEATTETPQYWDIKF
ncbi:brevican core protein-like [Leuresthes tenuis]|uniref:brevican core protein-like n=1 Tax=Leuresthes tenuis TaxID=355514 RepID=UPI003B509FF8